MELLGPTCILLETRFIRDGTVVNGLQMPNHPIKSTNSPALALALAALARSRSSVLRLSMTPLPPKNASPF